MTYLLKNNQKARYIFLVISIFICFSVAAAEPLSVAAEESSAPIPEVGIAIASMVASGVGAYCASAVLLPAGVAALASMPLLPAVGIVIAIILAGMACALTVSMIATAINKAYEYGYFQQFVDKIVDSLNNGSLSLKIKLTAGAGLFSYLYSWVKEHIVGYYNEYHSNVNLGAAQNGYEILTPSHVFSSLPSDTQIMNNVNKPFGQISIDLTDFDELGTSDLDKSTPVVTITNPYTRITYNLQGSIHFAYDGANFYYRHFINKIMLSNHVTLISDTNMGLGGRGIYASENRSSIITFNEPFCFLLNSKYQLWFNTVFKRYDNGSLASTETVTPVNSNVTYSYEYNNYVLSISSGTVFIPSINKNIILEREDGTTLYSFYSLRHFFFECSTKVCNIKLVDRTNQVVSNAGSNANITNTVINNYYNRKSDALARPADVIKGKADDGAITDTTAGTVSIGVGELTSTVTDSTAITNAVTVDSITNTDVITDGQTVIGENALIDVAAALIISGNNARNGLQQIGGKFPFDVIPNTVKFLHTLVAEGEPLIVEYQFTVPLVGVQTVHMDFSRYQTVRTVFRWVVLVSVAILLLIASKYALQLV